MSSDRGRGGLRGGGVSYPLSRFVGGLGVPLGSPESTMGFHLREQACHSVDSYASKAGEHSPAKPRTKYLDGGGGGVVGGGFLVNHCYRAVLELLVQRMGSEVPREALSRGGVGGEEAEGSLCRAVRLVAEGGVGRQRLAGVSREKVHKHSSFGSYAKAVLRRARGGGGGGKRGGLGEWVDGRVEELLEKDLDGEFKEELELWHRPAIFYALR